MLLTKRSTIWWRFTPRYVIYKAACCNFFFMKVLETKNPTDATLVLSKLERILSKLVEFGADLGEDEKLEVVFDGRKELLTFFKVKS